MEQNLKEIFTEQVEIIKDNYGYDQKYFKPLAQVITDKEVRMLFCGMEVVLYCDGTYYINDTTGG